MLFNFKLFSLFQEQGMSQPLYQEHMPQQNAYYMDNRHQMMESTSGNGVCLLVSSLPEDLANTLALCNLFGCYGDVHR